MKIIILTLLALPWGSAALLLAQDAPVLDEQTAKWIDQIATALLQGDVAQFWKILLVPALWLLLHLLKGRVSFHGKPLRVPWFSDWWDRRAWYWKLAVQAAVGVAIGLATTLPHGVTGAAVLRGVVTGLGLAVGAGWLQGLVKGAKKPVP